MKQKLISITSMDSCFMFPVDSKVKFASMEFKGQFVSGRVLGYTDGYNCIVLLNAPNIKGYKAEVIHQSALQLIEY